jgi:acetyltransferase-like isoleucine patch superfamily enzyme
MAAADRRYVRQGVQTMSRWKRFARKPVYEKVNYIQTLYHRVKTQVFYRHAFMSIGSNCIIRRPLLLINCANARLGHNVSIREGARIEIVHSNSYRIPELRIGDNVNIEQNVQIVCHSRVLIGSNVSVTANCAIVDVTHPYASMKDIPKMANRVLDEDSYVEIADGAVLGYGCVILPNVRIGRMAFIGANAVVTKDVPDYGVVAGNPAKLLKVYECQEHRTQ